MSEFVIENGILKKYSPSADVETAVIPDEIHTIGSSAFANCSALKEIIIPDSVMAVKERAFEGCDNLEEIIFPDSVTEIGFAALFNCRKLKKIRISSSITIAKHGSFSASDDIVPDPRFKLFRNAFYGCISLYEIIAEGIKELDVSFAPMEQWESMELNIPAYIMPEIDLSKVKNTRIKQSLVLGYLKNTDIYSNHGDFRKLVCSQKNALLPLFIKNDNVAAIKILAEEKKITAKNYEEEYLNPANEAGAIQIKAFLLSWNNNNQKKKPGTGLELELKEKPVSLTALKKIWGWEDVKEGCVSINHYKGKDVELVIPSMLKDFHVTGIAKSCFSSVDRRITPERDEFFDKQLKTVTISDGIEVIGDYAFCSCHNLQSISLPATLKEIGAKAFHYCDKLTNISGTENITCIKRCAFELCAALSGDIRLTNAERIEDSAFNRCGGKLDIHLSDKLSYIGFYAFANCENLTLHAPAGSYAEKYAKENGIPFSAE